MIDVLSKVRHLDEVNISYDHYNFIVNMDR